MKNKLITVSFFVQVNLSLGCNSLLSPKASYPGIAWAKALRQGESRPALSCAVLNHLCNQALTTNRLTVTPLVCLMLIWHDSCYTLLRCSWSTGCSAGCLIVTFSVTLFLSYCFGFITLLLYFTHRYMWGRAFTMEVNRCATTSTRSECPARTPGNNSGPNQKSCRRINVTILNGNFTC